MKRERIFVSGGAGVIGNELVPLLQIAGHQVMVGDLKPRPYAWHPAIRYRQGDLNQMTHGELWQFAPTAFIHLAATFERSTETYGFWQENFMHNVQLSHHLMTLHKDLPDLRRVVFASSYLIYDPKMYSFDTAQSSARRLREDDPIYPRNLTGMAKLAHEIELRFIESFRQKQFSTVIARIYRGYGCGSHCVISRWIQALLKGDPIKVYRPEGLFDYIYAGETAKGLVKLLEHDALTGIVNLGSDRARSVSEVIDVLRTHFPEMATEVMDADIPFEASQANMDMFRAATGWVPERNLEECIPLIIAHEKKAALPTAQAPGHVLIGSAARKVPLVRAMKQAAAKLSSGIRVFGADGSPGALAQYFTDEFWPMPLLKDLTPKALRDYCLSKGVRAIVPTRDGELLWFANAAATLREHGISVMVSTPEAIDSCVDKLKFAALPGTIPTFLELPTDATGTWVVKERFGAGSRAIGLNMKTEDARRHAATLEHPIYQPFVHGREVSADVYVDRRGQIKGCVVRTRDVVVNGESQVTTTLPAPAVEVVCRAIVSALALYGHIVLQAIIDNQGVVHVIECNARFGGASSLSIAAGLDSFYWFLLESHGIDVSEYPCTYDAGKPLRQIRYAADQVLSA